MVVFSAQGACVAALVLGFAGIFRARGCTDLVALGACQMARVGIALCGALPGQECFPVSNKDGH